MAMPQNFRSAFNGFNRDDVVNYISYLTTKHENQLNQLHTEMEELRQELAERPAVPAVDETEVNALHDLVEHLQYELEQRDEIIAQLQAAAEVSAAPAAPAAPVVPAAPSFAEQELSAYRRAESAERRALERVNQLYAKANGVLADTVIRMDNDAELVAQMAEQVRAGLETLELAVIQSKTALIDSSAVLRSMQLNGEE